MKIPVPFIGFFIVLLSSCSVDSVDTLSVGGFSGLGVATDVAHAKGFFDEEKIGFVYERVDSSEELMTGLVSGQYDLIQTNADNVIAWAEGQGIDETRHDFVIVMGGYRGRQPLELIVAPEIGSVADLRGKELAVDAVATGYSTILIYILRQEGLAINRDYTLKPVGGGPKRIDALLRGETVGGFVVLNDELKQGGFHRLLSSADYIKDYARGVTTTRREWAQDNEDLLVRYVRAMVRAINWLLARENTDEAIAIIMAASGVSTDAAKAAYSKAVNPLYGFIPNARVNPSGIEQILKIRQVAGHMQEPLPSPEKYIEQRFHRQAIASLAP